jgi:hypothetical protein
LASLITDSYGFCPDGMLIPKRQAGGETGR